MDVTRLEMGTQDLKIQYYLCLTSGRYYSSYVYGTAKSYAGKVERFYTLFTAVKLFSSVAIFIIIFHIFLKNTA
jgi:hypothetical protein